MTETEVVRMMRGNLEALFPKVCPGCLHYFPTFREYLLNTEPNGSVMTHGAEIESWMYVNPIGTVLYSNCNCGATLDFGYSCTPLAQLTQLLDWARIEMQKRNMTPKGLLQYLRNEICKVVLVEDQSKYWQSPAYTIENQYGRWF
jgi:hypothetical protein